MINKTFEILNLSSSKYNKKTSLNYFLRFKSTLIYTKELRRDIKLTISTLIFNTNLISVTIYSYYFNNLTYNRLRKNVKIIF